VIALVRAAAGVKEREIGGYEQRRFVMRNGVWSGKDSASLAIKTLTISEEHRVLDRILLAKNCALTDETVAYHRRFVYCAAACSDEVLCYHARADERRGKRRTVDRAVAQFVNAFHLRRLAVKRYQIGCMRRQFVVYRDFASACLVKHRHADAVAKR